MACQLLVSKAPQCRLLPLLTEVGHNQGVGSNHGLRGSGQHEEALPRAMAIFDLQEKR